jgi:cytochrome c oxidase cbb3-type subunit III
VRNAAALLLLIAIPAMPQSRSDSAAVERGRELFASNCGFCHGAQAMGTEQAPPLARNRLTAQDRNGEILRPIIQAGRPSQGMPAFPSLTSAQISDIVSFLHVRAREIRGPRVPEESLLIGNAHTGEVYFNGAGNCSKCHSAAGDLKGIANKYSPLLLVTAFLTPRPQPIRVNVVQHSGEALSGVLIYADEFVVSFRDSAGEYRSFSRNTLRSVKIDDPLAMHKEQMARYSDDDIHNLLAYLITLK